MTPDEIRQAALDEARNKLGLIEDYAQRLLIYCACPPSTPCAVCVVLEPVLKLTRMVVTPHARAIECPDPKTCVAHMPRHKPRPSDSGEGAL